MGLAGRGLHVFPLAAGGKVPALSKERGGHGHLDATTDADMIRNWWTEMPMANIGLSCGPSGLLVLDVDPRNGGTPSLEGLLAEHGEAWTDTVSALTPAGGIHYYFTAPEGRFRCTSAQGSIAPGIDIKATGGYVACAPSRRPDGVYAWEPGSSIMEREPAEVPAWLAARLLTQAPLSDRPAPSSTSTVVEGRRNSELTSLAGSMRRRGMSEGAIDAALQAENRARCLPPLPANEVSAIVRSVARYAPGGDLTVLTSPDLFSLNSLISQPDDENAWPDPPGNEAFRGFAGEVVAAIEPHSEADRVALLINLLISFGAAVGAHPHVVVGATRHYPREFAVLVGRTSKARKGDSWPPINAILSHADPDWSRFVANGLSTGEGLIHAVRDPVEKLEQVKDRGRLTGEFHRVLVDEGVSDKRLLVMESEFARVLTVMQRQGNSLSPVLRNAWDDGPLRVMTRSNPLVATGAHICFIGHITVEELRRELPDVQAANGFANRMLFVAVRRSQLLPNPEPIPLGTIVSLGDRLATCIGQAASVGELRRDPEAADLWADTYADLSAERMGLVGALTARSEAHVLRLSMIYALLDGSTLIRVEHLAAALELWAYCEQSVLHVFGDSTGNPTADAILAALRAQGGLSRTDISALFGRHESAQKITLALRELQRAGKVTVLTEPTGGRPMEIWRAVA